MVTTSRASRSAVVEVLTVDPAEVADLARRVHEAEWMSAPDLVDYEVLNVLRKLVLGGHIDAELAEDSRHALQDLRLSRYPMSDEMAERVWQLRPNASAYDAAYIALAESLDAPLVTTESAGLTAAPARSAGGALSCDDRDLPPRRLRLPMEGSDIHPAVELWFV